MLIYIDDDYKCHVSAEYGTMAYETDIFEGKCRSFIEGYRIVPENKEWTRSDGVVFRGLMIAPWKPYAELERAQMQYELNQLKVQNAEYESALSEIEMALGVNS